MPTTGLLCLLSSASALGNCAFFTSTATASTGIYTLSLHDALPIFERVLRLVVAERLDDGAPEEIFSARDLRHERLPDTRVGERKSTRLNSSHVSISYAVFCLKKKKGASGAMQSFHCRGMTPAEILR